MDRGIIYKVFCIESQKGYIGQTIRGLVERRASHYYTAKEKRSSRSHFHAALRLYSKDTFVWSVLEENLPIANLNEREIYWITYYQTADPLKGYNLTFGGGGFRLTEKRVLSLETRKKIGDANRGKIRSVEVTDAMKKKALEAEEERRRRGDPHFNQGKIHTEEQNREHSEWLKENPSRKPGDWTPSEETRKKWSQQRKGRPAWNKGKTNIYSDEQRKKISDSLKRRHLEKKEKNKGT